MTDGAPRRAYIRRYKGLIFLVYDAGKVHIEERLLGPVLTLHHLTLAPLGERADELLDAWWALRAEAGITSIRVEYRAGDPYETYEVRPRAV